MTGDLFVREGNIRLASDVGNSCSYLCMCCVVVSSTSARHTMMTEFVEGAITRFTAVQVALLQAFSGRKPEKITKDYGENILGELLLQALCVG